MKNGCTKWLARIFGASLILFTAVSAAAGQEYPVSTREALQRILTESWASRPANAPPNPLFDFYASRNFVPAWTGGSDAENAAVAVLVTLSRAEMQGLRSQAYAATSARWREFPKPG